MTIPISPVQIHPEILGGHEESGVALLLSALQHRQVIDTERQKLAQQQQELDLQKKVKGAEIAGTELDNAKKAKDLKDRDEQLAAADSGLQIVTGNLMRLDDPAAWGQIVAGIKDPKVAQYVVGFRDNYLKQMQDIAHTKETQALALRAQQPPTGAFHFPIGPNGELYAADTRSGAVKKTGFNVGTRTPAQQQRYQFAAANVIEAVKAQEALLRKNPEADISSTMASIARGARTIPLVGGAAAGALEPAAQASMTPDQQEFQRLGDVILHNYGVFLGGQRSMTLLNNLRSSLLPVAGQTDVKVRRQAAAIRHNLIPLLQQIQKGGEIDMTKLPGFTDAATSGALQETTGQPGEGASLQPSYGDYLNGPPP